MPTSITTLRKSLAYNLVISLGLLTPLVGDTFHPLPVPEVVCPLPVKQAVVRINPDDWQSLAAAVSKQARQFGGITGYVIKDLKTGHTVSHNDNMAFLSASLIKLPILCAAFQAVQEGKISLSAPYTLQHSDRRGGSGVLKFAQPGSVFTIRELLEYMIVNSDNTATDIIVRQLGYEYLQRTFDSLGMKDTQIHAEGFRLTPRAVAEDNMTSPRDMAYCLEKIYQRQLVTPEASDQMLDILKHQHLRDRLPRFIPSGWIIAHKTGLLRKACHDVGIVFSPQGDYMICVLTAHDTTYKTAKHFIASMGRITFDYYGGGLHHPANRSLNSPTQAS